MFHGWRMEALVQHEAKHVIESDHFFQQLRSYFLLAEVWLITMWLRSNRSISQSVLSLFKSLERQMNRMMLSFCVCSFVGFIGVMLVIMSKLQHQVDLLCSTVPSTSQQSCGRCYCTLCFKLNREPLYSQYPPTKLLLHSLTQLKARSSTQILQAYWKSMSMHSSVHFVHSPRFWLASEKEACFSLPINSSAFIICATYSQFIKGMLMKMLSAVYSIDLVATFPVQFYCESFLAMARPDVCHRKALGRFSF